MDALIDKVVQLVKDDIRERVQEIDIDAEQEETFKKMLTSKVDLIYKHDSLGEVIECMPKH